MSDDTMLAEHRRTYRDFTRLVLWSVATVVATLALMAIFLL